MLGRSGGMQFLQFDLAEHGLVPDKIQRLIGKPPQIHLAERQWAGTRVIQQAAYRHRDTLGALDTLVDFLAPLVVGFATLKLKMGQNSEQRVVDLVRRA